MSPLSSGQFGRKRLQSTTARGSVDYSWGQGEPRRYHLVGDAELRPKRPVFCLYWANCAQMLLKPRALIDFLKDKRGAR
jgi:hypothetical protein